jgi:hypothetical protein
MIPMFYPTDAQYELSQYYVFQNYLPFWCYEDKTSKCNSESFIAGININITSENYGDIVILAQGDSVTSFYEGGSYQYFISKFTNSSLEDKYDYHNYDFGESYDEMIKPARD